MRPVLRMGANVSSTPVRAPTVVSSDPYLDLTTDEIVSVAAKRGEFKKSTVPALSKSPASRPTIATARPSLPPLGIRLHAASWSERSTGLELFGGFAWWWRFLSRAETVFCISGRAATRSSGAVAGHTEDRGRLGCFAAGDHRGTSPAFAGRTPRQNGLTATFPEGRLRPHSVGSDLPGASPRVESLPYATRNSRPARRSPSVASITRRVGRSPLPLGRSAAEKLIKRHLLRGRRPAGFVDA